MADTLIHEIPTTTTSFASDDYIVLDGVTNGTRNMTQANLKNSVIAGNIAPLFDPTRTSSNAYAIGDDVIYDGEWYSFKATHYGAWDVSHVNRNGSYSDYVNHLASASSLASTDVITVTNSTDGTRKMSKDDLMTEASQATLAGNLAPAFDPMRTEDDPYIAGQSVVYDGKTYTFKVDHYGAWNADHVIREPYENRMLSFSHILPKSVSVGRLVQLNGNVTSAAGFNVYVYDVSAGQDIYLLTATGIGYCAFYDASNTMVGNAYQTPSAGDVLSVGRFSVPDNAVVLRVTCNTASFKRPILSVWGGYGDEANKSQMLSNALVGNIAPAFDPTRTSENPYKAGESVVYSDYRIYTFKVDHYGDWNASHVQSTDEFWRYSFPGECYQDGFTIMRLNQVIGQVQADAQYRTLRVGCVPGQKFYIRALFNGGNASRMWCTFDEYGLVKRWSGMGLDTRDNPAIVTIAPGEYGIAFNVVKAQLFFIACSVPNFIFSASNKLAEVDSRTAQDSANTPIPFDSVLDDTYIISTGAISHTSDYAVYEYAVNPGSKINIKTAGNAFISFYDNDDSVVGTPFSIGYNTFGRVKYSVDVPSTATRLKVSCLKSYNDVALFPSVMSCDGFGMKKMIESQRQSEARIFEGKNILCIGDSITEHGTWFSSLLQVTGAAKIWNRGAGGTTLASYPGSTDSMCDRADLDPYDGTGTSLGFPSDSNVDVVIVWGGTNDFGLATKNVQFGTEVKNDKMYFLSAVLYLINKLKIKYPTKPIYFCGIMTAQSPEGNQWSRYTITDGAYTERANWTGKTVTDFNEAIKRVSAMAGVHYIDMDRCGISPVIDTEYSAYFDTLGLHPNTAGGERIGRYIAESLVYDS